LNKTVELAISSPELLSSLNGVEGIGASSTKNRHTMNHSQLTLVAFQKYDEWVNKKKKTYNSTCMGWVDYKEWIERLFDLAPPAPDCNVVKNFRTAYKNTGFIKGTLVLSRNKEHNAAFSLDDPAERLKGRQLDFAAMWKKANGLRNLPPNLEMLVYVNDKPRVRTDLDLPAFTIAGQFRAGSGMPTRWTNYLPFPSHFYSFKIPKQKDLPDFESKPPVVFFRVRVNVKVGFNQ
jgi:hypothetical protein